jgi:predicted NAD/FAD-dependent oxidoreductase
LVQASTLHPDVPEADIRDHLRSWYGAAVDRWSLLATYDIPYALPAAEPPQGRLRKPVRAAPGLYVCGDWRDSPSIQGAMVSGRRAAHALLVDQPAADQPERTHS